MATVFDVAAYILSKPDLDEGDGITHMKLQKLLYYVQGFAVVILGRPLFKEKMEAWPHGPVVPNLYYKYKSFGNNIIDSSLEGDSEALSEEERALIDEVYEVYGQYSALKLRDLTHSEAPWQEAENKNDIEITIEALRSFFPALITE